MLQRCNTGNSVNEQFTLLIFDISVGCHFSGYTIREVGVDPVVELVNECPRVIWLIP
jgi:hypothetical protein